MFERTKPRRYRIILLYNVKKPNYYFYKAEYKEKLHTWLPFWSSWRELSRNSDFEALSSYVQKDKEFQEFTADVRTLVVKRINCHD